MSHQSFDNAAVLEKKKKYFAHLDILLAQSLPFQLLLFINTFLSVFWEDY